MTTVIRVVQAVLLLAGLGACAYAAVMVIEAASDANSECFVQEQQRSGLVQEQPANDVCVGLEQFQVEATGAIAMAIAGLTAAASAAALNGMAQPRAAQRAASFPTATPAGGVQQPGGYAQTGQYPPQAGQYPQAGQQYPQAGQGQYGQQPPG